MPDLRSMLFFICLLLPVHVLCVHVCVLICVSTEGAWGLHCTTAGPSTSARNKLCLMKSGNLPKRCPPSPQVIITHPPSAFPSSLFSLLLLSLFILIFYTPHPPLFSLPFPLFFFSLRAPALSSFCQQGIGTVTLSSVPLVPLIRKLL